MRNQRALGGEEALLGVALLLSDGMITPAISVLSAVEGLEVATVAAKPFVVPLTCLVLLSQNHSRCAPGGAARGPRARAGDAGAVSGARGGYSPKCAGESPFHAQ